MAKTEKKPVTRADYDQLEAEYAPRAGNPGKPLAAFLQEVKAGAGKPKQQRKLDWLPRKGAAK